MLTSLILICTFLVGLLLCADDLVVRMPAVIRGTIQTVRDAAGIRENIKGINWNIVPLPKLPALPQFVTKDALAQKTGARSGPVERITTDDVGGFDDDDEEDAPRVLPRLEKPLPKGKKRAMEDEIHLEYENDEPAPAAQDVAYSDEEEPEPSAAATIPPLEESKVARPAMVINSAANATGKNVPGVAAPRSVATSMPVGEGSEVEDEDRVTEVTQPTEESRSRMRRSSLRMTSW